MAQRALDGQLAHFLDADGQLIHEDLRGRPADNRFPGIESTVSQMGVGLPTQSYVALDGPAA